MKFQVSSYIQKISTLVDGGMKLDIITSELPPDQTALLFSLKGKQGWFLFADNDIQESDIPKESAMVDKNEKTPSQRLRGVLYKLYEKNKSGKETFAEYYNKNMEKILETLKEKI